MKLEPAPDRPENLLFHRLVSETGLIEMGIHPVLFGYRVRAGFTDSPWGVELDWCGGADWQDVRRLYSIAAAILRSRPEDGKCFAGLPGHSQVKPFVRDQEFTNKIITAVDGPLALLDIDIL